MQIFFQKMWIKKLKISYFLLHSSFLSIYLHKSMHKKMNFSVKNFFSKCEYIRIKLRIYSHLLNKSLTENFIFCVANIIGFTPEPCKFFSKPNWQSLVYFTSINTCQRLVSSLLCRNQLLTCSKRLELSAQELLHDNQYTFTIKTFFKNFYWLKKPLETCR